MKFLLFASLCVLESNSSFNIGADALGTWPTSPVPHHFSAVISTHRTILTVVSIYSLCLRVFSRLWKLTWPWTSQRHHQANVSGGALNQCLTGSLWVDTPASSPCSWDDWSICDTVSHGPLAAPSSTLIVISAWQHTPHLLSSIPCLTPPLLYPHHWSPHLQWRDSWGCI